MNAGLIHRRKQFSSCDACRKSRVACDAVRGRSATGLAACTRCANRNRRCSFEWMERAAVSSNNRTLISNRRDHRPSPPTDSSPIQVVEGSLIPRQQNSMLGSPSEREEEDASDDHWYGSPTPFTPAPAVNTDIADWLYTMYEDVFEAVFGSWLGNYSCPFVFGEHRHLENGSSERTPLALSISISSLCRQFDQWMKDLEAQENDVASDQAPTQAEVKKERQIDHCLNQAIQTFSARWLPLTFESPLHKAAQTELIESLWRGLRKDLIKIINRPCYRSMLCLFLFAMVPIPAGISEEEEDSGIPAQFCVQAALQHVQHLRARQRSLEFNGSKVCPISDRVAIMTSLDQFQIDFMSMESIIYWAALTYDTSSSLTFNTKSLLSSGLLGWESESSWRLVKTCTDIFHNQTEDWRLRGVIVTEENANRIIAAASAWKLRVWKVAAVLKEALREGHEEDAVHRVYTSAVDAIKQFNMTYRPLLVACERRIQFLSQHTKLRWCEFFPTTQLLHQDHLSQDNCTDSCCPTEDEVMLHYHLCILIMIDAIETAGRTDILDRLIITRSEAEGSTMNCLVFGLSNHFVIPQRKGEMEDTFVTVPLVAIDPYPHHVVAAVRLLWLGIERDYETGKLDLGTLENLQSTLLRTLDLLPQTSKSVRNAKEQARLSVLHKEIPGPEL